MRSNKLIIYLGIFFFLSCNSEKKDVAIMRIASDSFNIGEVKKDGQARISFYIYNIGNKILIIKSLGVDCGCTKVNIKDSTIRPSDSTKVFMEYTAKLAGDSGNFYKSVVIRSNDSIEYKVIRLFGTIIK